MSHALDRAVALARAGPARAHVSSRLRGDLLTEQVPVCTADSQRHRGGDQEQVDAVAVDEHDQFRPLTIGNRSACLRKIPACFVEVW
jgi:hypothetical protein